ncbi:uncharacterized protein Z520_10438 [Fonsecaea multimorphosa CBS 102226]|uniref:Zn(2)-C6 fungal-type domain-containing protein n=1 Tax=Fonsecaea multimorphosa CBS 102226 TaxID=1442371 RepID=A0A0D2KB71_9EURO|nr:uncharacterized protein Z520_10438 [Fonsecaea multimorphosa CBS 102226]KIX93813.1 hypothetical protein Z520_10438 [Fonsecaea multimorphosa CBS 102226]
MGRHRRRTGHLQGTFRPPWIEPSQGPGQFELCLTQPQCNQPSRPVFSTPVLQPHRPSGRACGYGFLVAEHPNTPSTTDALSPVSTRSTLSRDSVATSTSTSYTAALGRARKFSPEADGTLSPSASGSTCQPVRLAGHASDQPLNSPFLASGYTLGADHAMTEAEVVGIVNRVPFTETPQYFSQGPPLYLRPNASPVGHQRYPSQPDPWSGHPLRSENQYLNTGTSTPVLHVQDHRRSLPIRERGGGGRTGPLDPDQRQRTRDVRKRGACLRCAIMKEKCDLQSPCNNCSTKERRKCPKYCIPLHCDWDGCQASLFPDELTSSLRGEDLRQYLQSFTNRGPCRPFQIQLDLHIGIPLYVHVVEFSPQQDSEIRYAFQTSHDSNGQKSFDRQENWNPPIIMWIRDGGEEAVKKVRKNLTGIFDQVLNDPKKYAEWTEDYFEDSEEDFPAKILRLIGRYYRDHIEEHSVLKDSLRLLWYEYLLLNRFIIPAEAIPTLEDNLASRRPFGVPPHVRVIPETINRFLKAAILAGAEKAAENLCKSLHHMMWKMAYSQESPQDNRDLILCMLFVLVIFLGRTQLALSLLAHMPGTAEEMACPPRRTEDKIEQMEERVCGYLLSFHKYALSRASRTPAKSRENCSASERHALEFNLEAQLQHVIEDHVHEKPESLEPGDYEMNTFRYRNVRRLCWKVIENMK